MNAVSSMSRNLPTFERTTPENYRDWVLEDPCSLVLVKPRCVQRLERID